MFRSLALISFLVIGLPFAVVADEGRFIEVYGESVRELVPDEIHVHVRLESQAWSIKSAKTELSKTVKRVLKHAKSFQVDSKRIKTDAFSVVPQYSSAKEFEGYFAKTSLTIIFTEEDSYYKFMHKLPSEAPKHTSHVQFKLSHLGKRRIELEKLALLDARQRARVLVKTMDVTLGSLLQVKDVRVQGMDRSRGTHLMHAEPGNVAMEPGSKTVRGFATARFAID